MSKKITKQEIIDFMSKSNWNLDRYGNLQKVVKSQTYRIKFQAQSVRIEAQCVHTATEYSPQSKEWVKIGGDYMKDIHMANTSDGRTYLKIGNRCFVEN